ncbi:MAG: 4Fe-4S dicluster domain-containing protein [Bacteroidia bacterium]|nr:4Fe-4S dicluster domain-containing protein [Bacteroidia bacterium]
MQRQIITIDETLCNGCGACIPNCHEGALQIIDGKARLVSDLMCDGLGACIGYCPLGAITVEEREAEPYDEVKVISGMVSKGENTIFAHLKHLKDHSEFGFLKQGLRYLEENRSSLRFNPDLMLKRIIEEEPAERVSQAEGQLPLIQENGCGGGCPGLAAVDFSNLISSPDTVSEKPANLSSTLTHWPVQLHLLNPDSSHFRRTDLLLAADCTAYTTGRFHSAYLKGKTLAIACPKLDSGLDSYIGKIRRLIDDAEVNTITVLLMEVPCCGGLLEIIRHSMVQAKRKIPVKVIVIDIHGVQQSEEWMMF